jgi:tRNA G26 N,N-dimethylase Trm1
MYQPKKEAWVKFCKKCKMHKVLEHKDGTICQICGNKNSVYGGPMYIGDIYNIHDVNELV